ncbi:MAG TPA: TlpA disulfide reductase family protein, partial [Candidatus Saccharimonadales bacterium]|nr:TlpA disulfide reductase family protein [Candidatus Saccharimonadales bacterium]
RREHGALLVIAGTRLVTQSFSWQVGLWNRQSMKTVLTALACLSLSYCSISYALQIGDPAPPLAVAKWAKGGPINLSEGKGKNVYVVEFWATWCAPCLKSIPHLSELQRKYKDKNLVIVGVTDETIQKVKPFIDKMGAQMDYAVALDKDEQTYNAYMKPFDVDGVPEAFIVDREGRLVWHGEHMEELDKALEQVLAGTYDVEGARIKAQVLKLEEEYFTLVSAEVQSPRADELGKQISESLVKAPRALNDFAWQILTDKDIRQRDLSLALRSAKKAYEVSQGKTAAITETYARALFETDSLQDAVKFQQEAVEGAQKPEEKADFEKTLAKYKTKLAERKKAPTSRKN